MKCPLCHSEDTYEQDEYLCCRRCGAALNVMPPILDDEGVTEWPPRQEKLPELQPNKLDKIHTDFELHRLVRDVERGVNRP
jgi:hypothetical protein